MDHSERALSASRCQMDAPCKVAVEGRKKSESRQGNAEVASSSPESGSTNGEGKRPAKTRRRRKRSSNPEPHPEAGAAAPKGREEVERGGARPADTCSALLGLRSETASVWLERSVYEQAEGRYQCWLALSVGGAATAPNGSDALSARPAGSPTKAGRCPAKKPKQPQVPDTLSLAPAVALPVTPPTPDEGYQTRPPTPATPINGLPRLAAELLREVWLEKPLYDRAEAAFYQHLYGNNNSSGSKRTSPYGTSRSPDHPQSLVEEEEEEEGGAAGAEEEEESQVVPQGKAEVFHALHPIQEEEEPAEVGEEREVAGIRFSMHPDSERVWLDRWRYDAAESRLHCQCVGAVPSGARRPGRKAVPVASGTPRRDNTTMSSVDFFAQDKIWFEKPRYDEAERLFYERQSGPLANTQLQDAGANSILQDIARARENIQKSLAGTAASGAGDQGELVSRMKTLELENQSLHKVVEDLRSALSKLESRVAVLEKSPAAALAPTAPCTNGTAATQQKSSVPAAGPDDDDDDDLDLFGSDEDDAETERIKQQRLNEYAARKAKKPALIAKSAILLDVKPWDDETDMGKLEECVRSVQTEGLLWGTSKLLPVGYGIRKLQIACVVEDDKVGTDLLEEEITKFEDYIQSVDIAAFNKI